ncbi:MAG TPA: threonine/serine exporter family protein [Ignavibacteria bacterium]|nr:threonine/serine exporter family protein [Ignavibacteria bacterium]
MNKTEEPENSRNIEVCKFIIEFGKTAHKYGIPDGQLEIYLLRLSKAFGIDGEFRSSPDHLLFAFRTENEYWQKINLTSVSERGFNMAKLSKLDMLVNNIISGKLDIDEAQKQIESLKEIKDPYGKFLTAVSFVLFGSGFAAILSGGWMDILWSGVLSLLVYIIKLVSDNSKIIPISTAFAAGFFAVVIKFYIPQLNYVLVSLSAIIIMVPGYSISVGISELVKNNIISGMGNLNNGLVYLLKQFTGTWLGYRIATILAEIPETPANSIDPVWLWLFLPLMLIGLLIIFRISSKDFVWAFICCAIGYLGVVYGSMLLSNNLGILIGATAISSYAILWERQIGRPGSIVFLPAVMILVGGSSGFRGLIAAAQGDAGGQGQFLEMFYIAFTITAGLVISNTVFKSKGNL